MIARIMRHEWTLLTREKVLYVAIPLYALLLAYGILSGTQWKEFLQANTMEAVELADKGLQNTRDKLDRILYQNEKYSYAEDPRLPGPLARYKGYEMAAKPPSSTASIAIGQSDVVPSYLKVQWKPMVKQSNTEEIENPQNLEAGAFDLSFIIVYLFPLLIIALSYNILSSERENGTQALLLSQPVSVREFVAGKILLRGVLIVGLAVGISIIGLLISNPDIISSGELWRIMTLAVALTVYGVFWFGLTVLVNAFGKNSATNAMVLMATWIGLVLVLPSALNLAAKSIYPLPSRIEMVQAMRQADEQAQAESKFDRAYRADLLRKGEEAALEASSADFYKKVLPVEKRSEEISFPIFNKFEQQRLNQQQLAERMKYLSPAAIIQIAMSELANHSAQNFNDFNNQVKAYHEVWRNYFFPIVMEGRLMTRDELHNIPRFTYQPESDSVVAGRLFKDILALTIFAGVAVLVGFLQLRKYPAAGR